MRSPVCIPVLRLPRIKNPPRRRHAERKDERERLLRERVAFMLWVMANRVD